VNNAGAIHPGYRMKIGMSVNHRVVDARDRRPIPEKRSGTCWRIRAALALAAGRLEREPLIAAAPDRTGIFTAAGRLRSVHRGWLAVGASRSLRNGRSPGGHLLCRRHHIL